MAAPQDVMGSHQGIFQARLPAGCDVCAYAAFAPAAVWSRQLTLLPNAFHAGVGILSATISPTEPYGARSGTSYAGICTCGAVYTHRVAS